MGDNVPAAATFVTLGFVVLFGGGGLLLVAARAASAAADPGIFGFPLLAEATVRQLSLVGVGAAAAGVASLLVGAWLWSYGD